MRLWTIHPRYLDAQGLVAVWREGLLALKVLQGETRGYRHHPQLERFRACPDPLAAIIAYLHGIHAEACTRGYHFDTTKLPPLVPIQPLPETRSQLLFEWKHLKHKLMTRNPDRYAVLLDINFPEAHPLFRIVPGEVRPWERGIPLKREGAE